MQLHLRALLLNQTQLLRLLNQMPLLLSYTRPKPDTTLLLYQMLNQMFSFSSIFTLFSSATHAPLIHYLPSPPPIFISFSIFNFY